MNLQPLGETMAPKPARSKKAATKKTAKPMAKKTVAKKKARPAAANRKAAKPMLHGIAFSGPTYKVALMFALAGEPFAYKHMDMQAGAHKTPDYLAINRY